SASRPSATTSRASSTSFKSPTGPKRSSKPAKQDSGSRLPDPLLEPLPVRSGPQPLAAGTPGARTWRDVPPPASESRQRLAARPDLSARQPRGAVMRRLRILAGVVLAAATVATSVGAITNGVPDGDAH